MGGHGGIIEELTADHREVQRLLDRVRCAPPGGAERKTLVERAAIVLVRHTVAEKEYLYPAVRRYVLDGDGWADRALAGHRALAEILADLEEREPGDEGFGRLLPPLVTEVTRHVVEAEQRLFPRLMAVCPEEELRRLGARVREVEPKAPTRPRPGAPQAAPLVKAAARVWGPWDRLRDVWTRRGRR
ncbi:hemerythrin superfamily protein [Streptomyces sp. B3I7]|uniref:hemerythrin domain-containing protein n=1 Tax=Streptomyces sp. B3I7 TaxID=3042269 RepID=UPI0027828BEA|nr:hemerythrin domain-containing protein [Streptomyces sp. B3I7]MDQ0809228.1 hemerythrin superfamily protein [Streptomyces sp. B3I7]